MKIIRYGFFGEDDAQRIFLRHYLNLLSAEQDFRFDEDIEFPLAGRTKSIVKSQFAEACELGLTQYKQDCFFVGLDLDEHDIGIFQETVREMKSKLADRNLSAILLIPVQCIEHWLRYLQWHVENPNSTKNVTLENEERRTAKAKLYGSPKTSTKHSNPIVESISATLDIAWLESRSNSFLAFHGQVRAYLQSEGFNL